ncbi:hypothetical protein [Lentzea nigeriaca]|uniref:hypothetical protein n=1 Tax=Lentzea nigeriaca TaxID=1128665 RepID=UPI001959A8DF|nr:hypothetical protein [Lentzea nigeriaca]MBM7856906.1 hypothetical protein [Lentzea nigeriaca]
MRDSADQPGHVDGAVAAVVAQNTGTAEVVIGGIRVELIRVELKGTSRAGVHGTGPLLTMCTR